MVHDRAPRLIPVALGALLAGLAASAPAAPAALAIDEQPVTALVFDGDAGYYPTGLAHETLLAPEHPMSTLAVTGDVSINVPGTDPRGGGAGSWTWSLSMPYGQDLAPGTYQTGPAGSPTNPSADFHGMGRGCNGTEGEVAIHELAVDSGTHTLVTFAATFLLACAGTSATVHGEIRYQSSRPWTTATVDHATLDFGTDPWGGPAVDREVTVTSTGTGPLHVGPAVVTGADADAYTIPSDTCSNSDIAPAATCTIVIRFNAVLGHGGSARLDIPDDAVRDLMSVALTGEAVPSWSTDPWDLEFGSVSDMTSATRTFTVRYDGDGSLAITGVAIAEWGTALTGDFSVATETCTTAPVPSGGTCTVTVRFAPSSLGEQRAIVVLHGSSPLPPEGANAAGMHAWGSEYEVPATWGTRTTASPAYTWNNGGALARSVSATHREYYHGIAMTDRVGGKWVTNSGPRMGVLYQRSTNGSTWSSAKRLNASTTHGYWASIAASGKYVDAVWVQSAKVFNFRGTAPRVLYIRRNTNYGNASAWGSVRRLTSTTGRIDMPSVAVSGSRVLVAWTDSATGSIKVALSKDSGVRFKTVSVGTTSRLTGLGRVGLPKVAISGTTAIVSWISNRDGAIKARVSTNGGSSWGSTRTVATTSSSGPTVAAASGRAIVAFSTGQIATLLWKGSWEAGVRYPAWTGFWPDYAPAVVLRGTSQIGLAWGGCRSDAASDCQEATADTLVDLVWAESPDNGVHWGWTPIAQSFDTTVQAVNEVPSIAWGNARVVTWNAWTYGTSYYRLHGRVGFNPVVPAGTALTAVPLSEPSRLNDVPAGSGGCSGGLVPAPRITPERADGC